MRILIMYATLMPVVIAGAANMLFTKTRLYRNVCAPIDGGKCCSDGKRIFGDNKTWAGFFGMIAANCLAQILWGLLSQISAPLGNANEMYRYFSNTLLFNAVAGALFGFVYVLFELPTSFLKRRLDIQPGKTAQGGKGALFFVIARSIRCSASCCFWCCSPVSRRCSISSIFCSALLRILR